jgi:acetylornithine deacetylase
MSRCLHQVIAADPWLTAHPPSLEWFEGQFEPGETSLKEPIIAALGEAHARILGSVAAIQGVPYGSDLRLFTLYGKVPCALYGPGDVAFAHTVEEHVVLDEVFTCARIIASLIVDWCGGRLDA